MKIVVIGGTGLIGKKVVSKLRALGHEVVSASPSSGVNTLTGAGLSAALHGAEVVVDVANSPSFEDMAAMDFFTTAGRNITKTEIDAGVKHHVALSVVGTDRLQDSGYFRAKQAQENLIKESKIPYSIVQATQFFEFVGSIAESGKNGDTIRMTNALFQPMAAQDVAEALVDVILGTPLNKTIEIAGPEKIGMDAQIRKYLDYKKDNTQVITDPEAYYFGLKINDQSLTPKSGARLGATRYDDWIKNQEI